MTEITKLPETMSTTQIRGTLASKKGLEIKGDTIRGNFEVKVSPTNVIKLSVWESRTYNNGKESGSYKSFVKLLNEANEGDEISIRGDNCKVSVNQYYNQAGELQTYQQLKPRYAEKSKVQGEAPLATFKVRGYFDRVNIDDDGETGTIYVTGINYSGEAVPLKFTLDKNGIDYFSGLESGTFVQLNGTHETIIIGGEVEPVETLGFGVDTTVEETRYRQISLVKGGTVLELPIEDPEELTELLKAAKAATKVRLETKKAQKEGTVPAADKDLSGFGNTTTQPAATSNPFGGTNDLPF